MCGILGIYSLDGQAIRDVPAALPAMLAQLRHRGPDEQRAIAGAKVALGVQRLSIVDRLRGSQPMKACGDILTVVNGEIFNHAELRMDLSDVHKLTTDCDVEVVGHLIESHGNKALSMLDGQFAIASYEISRNRLLLARDQFGICPLHYAVWDGLLLFASEIKAILAYPGFPCEFDLRGLDHVMTFPGMVSPQTMFRHVYALPPGCFLTAERGTVKVEEYWDLVYPWLADARPAQTSAAAAAATADELLHLLDRSVRRRFMGESAVGAYLSGGLDSSIVSALAARTSRLKALYSVGFANGHYDESPHQRTMEGHLDGVRACHKKLTDPEIAERLWAAVYHAECPIRESYYSAGLALSEMALHNGTRVILSGEGADEWFGGYASYRWDKFYEHNPGRRPGDRGANDSYESEMRDRLWGDPTFSYEQSFTKIRNDKKALLLPDAFTELQLVGVGCTSLVPPDRVAGRHRLHKRSYLDFRFRLADHLLGEHGDRLALANSIEGRYPFVDRGVVEFIRAVDPELHFVGYAGKALLRSAASSLLPASVRDREKLPFASSSSAELVRCTSDLLDLVSPAQLQQQNIFNPDAITALVKQSLEPDYEVAVPIETDWLMIVLTFQILLDTWPTVVPPPKGNPQPLTIEHVAMG